MGNAYGILGAFTEKGRKKFSSQLRHVSIFPHLIIRRQQPNVCFIHSDTCGGGSTKFVDIFQFSLKSDKDNGDVTV
jgi:hypothetical protein